MNLVSEFRCGNSAELLSAIQTAMGDVGAQGLDIYPMNGGEWIVRLAENKLTDGSLVYHLQIAEAN